MSDNERWSKVKGRLRSSVGEDVFSSWFARMDLERVSGDAVHMSVPTRFLRSWIQAHYADRVLSCWQSEMPEVKRVELSVRTALRSPAPARRLFPSCYQTLPAPRPPQHPATCPWAGWLFR